MTSSDDEAVITRREEARLAAELAKSTESESDSEEDRKRRRKRKRSKKAKHRSKKRLVGGIPVRLVYLQVSNCEWQVFFQYAITTRMRVKML